MADLHVSLPELNPKMEEDDPITKLLQFKAPVADASKISVPDLSNNILPAAPAPVILPATPAPVILPATPAPVILPATPAPVILPPAPAPVILPPAPAPVILSHSLPPAPAPIHIPVHAPPPAPVVPGQPIHHHVPEINVPVPGVISVSIKSHRNRNMSWHEPGQEFNVNSMSGSYEEAKKFLSQVKDSNVIPLFELFIKGTEKDKNIGPLFEHNGYATLVLLSKIA
jgi:hypothetical protein